MGNFLTGLCTRGHALCLIHSLFSKCHICLCLRRGPTLPRVPSAVRDCAYFSGGNQQLIMHCCSHRSDYYWGLILYERPYPAHTLPPLPPSYKKEGGQEIVILTLLGEIRFSESVLIGICHAWLWTMIFKANLKKHWTSHETAPQVHNNLNPKFPWLRIKDVSCRYAKC